MKTSRLKLLPGPIAMLRSTQSKADRTGTQPNVEVLQQSPEIRVALIVIEGVVGGPVTRARFTDRPDDAYIAPAGIATIAVDLVAPDRSAWSSEVEVRPFKEKW